MATTTSGWPYVLPADHPKEYPAASQALANKLESAVNLGGGWQAYTPTPVGATFSSLVGRWARIGKTVHVNINGAVTAVTAGMTFSMPVAAAATSSAVGTALFLGVQPYGGHVYISGGQMVARPPGTNGLLLVTSPTYPFTWAAGNYVGIVATYEAA